MADLRSATDAIVNRVEASSATATSEDLVYLAKALEGVSVTSAVNFVNATSEQQAARVTATGDSQVTRLSQAGDAQITRVTSAMGTAIGAISVRGDLLTHNGTNPTRLPVGLPGQIVSNNWVDAVWAYPDSRLGSNVASLPDITQGGCGPNFMAFPLANGQIKTVGSYCGGSLAHGNDGNNSVMPNVAIWDNNYIVTEGIKQVVCGYNFLAVVTNIGNVYFSGNNSYGQFGLGDTTNRYILTKNNFFASINKTVKKIVVTGDNNWNYTSIYFLTNDNLLYAAGYNGCGELGDGTTTNRATPVRCGALTGVNDIWAFTASAGSAYASVGSAKDLYAWGYNGNGQLGLGDTTNRTTPIKTSVTNVTKVICSGGGRWNGTNYGTVTHSVYALTPTGLLSTGINDYGQIGVGDGTQRTLWISVGGSMGVPVDVKTSCMEPHTVALLPDGTIRTWGANAYGQLGMGDTNGRSAPSIPTLPTGFGPVTKIFVTGGTRSGGNNTLIVSAYGKVAVCGANQYGDLGTGDGSSRNTFTLISLPFDGSLIKDVLMVTEPHYYGRTYILLNDGRVFATGYGASYGLGVDPNTNNSYSFHQVLI